MATRERTCIDCAAPFPGGTRSRRCKPCRYAYDRARKTAWDRAQAAKRRPAAPPEIPGLIPIYYKSQPVDFARVDLADWDRFKHLRLTPASKGYAAARIDGRREYLHRLVLNLKPGADRKTVQVDHINRNVLDNRRSNLRVVTAKENCANRGGIYEAA
jgi:hypothetical protein